MAYIYPAPGVAGVETTLKLYHTSKTADSTGLAVPALQDITINAGKDVFTWTQLDSASKLQLPTTAANSIGLSIVLDQEVFFGTTGTGTTAAGQGILGLSNNSTLIEFELYMGDTSDGDTGKTMKGFGYITGIAPTVSADSPVWTSPVTITVTGDYSVA